MMRRKSRTCGVSTTTSLTRVRSILPNADHNRARFKQATRNFDEIVPIAAIALLLSWCPPSLFEERRQFSNITTTSPSLVGD